MSDVPESKNIFGSKRVGWPESKKFKISLVSNFAYFEFSDITVCVFIVVDDKLGSINDVTNCELS